MSTLVTTIARELGFATTNRVAMPTQSYPQPDSSDLEVLQLRLVVGTIQGALNDAQGIAKLPTAEKEKLAALLDGAKQILCGVQKASDALDLAEIRDRLAQRR